MVYPKHWSSDLLAEPHPGIASTLVLKPNGASEGECESDGVTLRLTGCWHRTGPLDAPTSLTGESASGSFVFLGGDPEPMVSPSPDEVSGEGRARTVYLLSEYPIGLNFES